MPELKKGICSESDSDTGHRDNQGRNDRKLPLGDMRLGNADSERKQHQRDRDLADETNGVGDRLRQGKIQDIERDAKKGCPQHGGLEQLHGKQATNQHPVADREVKRVLDHEEHHRDRERLLTECENGKR